MAGIIKNLDVFKIMDIVGIMPEDRLYCLDLVQGAKSEVMKDKQFKDGIK